MIPIAERRMFAKSIIDSDAFLDMSVTARLLYYDLSMRADDDGFVNSPKKIMRMVGASEDDLRMLAARKFIIPFENGVVVIKHWRIHNYIRKDRYNETHYSEQKEMLELDENGSYRLVDQRSTDGLPMVDQRLTQVRLGKDRLVKDNIKKSAEALFDEIEDEELKSLYIDFYEMRKKMKAPMTDKAVKLLISKVSSLEQDVERQKRLLNEAILHGWKSVYPLKDNANARESSQEALSQADRDFVEYLEGR